MTIKIKTDERREDEVPALHIETLRDLSPRDDHLVMGGARPSHSGGYSC